MSNNIDFAGFLSDILDLFINFLLDTVHAISNRHIHNFSENIVSKLNGDIVDDLFSLCGIGCNICASYSQIYNSLCLCKLLDNSCLSTILIDNISSELIFDSIDDDLFNRFSFIGSNRYGFLCLRSNFWNR